MAAIVVSFVLGLAEQLCVAGRSVCEVCKLKEDLELREGELEPPNGTGHGPGSCLGWEIDIHDLWKTRKVGSTSGLPRQEQL